MMHSTEFQFSVALEEGNQLDSILPLSPSFKIGEGEVDSTGLCGWFVKVWPEGSEPGNVGLFLLQGLL